MKLTPEARTILTRLEEGHIRTAGRLGDRAFRRLVRALRPTSFGSGAHEAREAQSEARSAAQRTMHSKQSRCVRRWSRLPVGCNLGCGPPRA